MQESILGHRLDGRYRIIRKLASGGFGQTYIAEDSRRPGNPCCVVKLLKPASNDPEFLKNARRLFNTEAEALEVLGNHSQIPRLLAYFEELGDFYLVQEYVDGALLTEELPIGRRWTANKTARLMEEILTVLRFIHSHNVIHRDIKPDNIIRRRCDNTLVLVDFGTVKQVRTQVAVAGQATATISVGTPGYMPTEQSHGKPRPNSDIYALGIIAIQAITGLHPTQIQEDPESGELIWEPWAACDQGLVRIVSKMVRYHFRDRYRSTSEALQALSRYQTSYASFNQEPIISTHEDKPLDKRRMPQSTVIVQPGVPSQTTVVSSYRPIQPACSESNEKKSLNKQVKNSPLVRLGPMETELDVTETEVVTENSDNLAAETIVADRLGRAALGAVRQAESKESIAASSLKVESGMFAHHDTVIDKEPPLPIAELMVLPAQHVSNELDTLVAEGTNEESSQVSLLDSPVSAHTSPQSSANVTLPLNSVSDKESRGKNASQPVVDFTETVPPQLSHLERTFWRINIAGTFPLEMARLQLQNSYAFLNRWRKLGIAGGLAFSVAVGGGYILKERAVWSEANRKVAQIKGFQTKQAYEECVASAQAIPQRYDQLYTTAQDLIGACLLGQAEALSKEQRFKDAINTAEEISPGMTSYSAAQAQIQSWAKSIVDIATDGYKKGKFESAKGIIQAVPKNASVYDTAQKTLTDWEAEWQKNKDSLSAAKMSLGEKDWQAAIDQVGKVTLLGQPLQEENPYWKGIVEPVMTTAEEGLLASQKAEQQRVAAQAAAQERQAATTYYETPTASYITPAYSEPNYPTPTYSAPAPSYSAPSYSAPSYSAPAAASGGGWTSEQR